MMMILVNVNSKSKPTALSTVTLPGAGAAPQRVSPKLRERRERPGRDPSRDPSPGTSPGRTQHCAQLYLHGTYVCGCAVCQRMMPKACRTWSVSSSASRRLSQASAQVRGPSSGFHLDSPRHAPTNGS